VALVYGYVRNQGSAAQWVMAQVQRALDAAAGTMEGAHQRFEEEVAGVMPLLRNVGRRLAELHGALADPQMPAPEAPAAAATRWHARGMAALRRALETAGARACDAATAARLADMAALAQRDGSLDAALAARLADPLALARIHGRCDLGHVLVTAGDAVFVGALGGLPGEDGDARNSVWRDVADLVASVETALAGLAAGEAAAAPEAPALRTELADAFRARAERAIVGAYAERVPAAPGRALLDVFLLEALARAIPAARPEALGALVAGLSRQARRLTRSAEGEAD